MMGKGRNMLNYEDICREKLSGERNLFLEGILEEQKNNQRGILVWAIDQNKVLSLCNTSLNIDIVLYDIEQEVGTNYVLLFDSNCNNQEELVNAIDFAKEFNLKFCGSTSWMPKSIAIAQ